MGSYKVAFLQKVEAGSPITEQRHVPWLTVPFVIVGLYEVQLTVISINEAVGVTSISRNDNLAHKVVLYPIMDPNVVFMTVFTFGIMSNNNIIIEIYVLHLKIGQKNGSCFHFFTDFKELYRPFRIIRGRHATIDVATYVSQKFSEPQNLVIRMSNDDSDVFPA